MKFKYRYIAIVILIVFIAAAMFKKGQSTAKIKKLQKQKAINQKNYPKKPFESNAGKFKHVRDTFSD